MSRVLKTGENQITQKFGGSHYGVDVVKKPSSLDSIIAHTAGTVILMASGKKNDTKATGTASYGNYVKIDHGNGYATLYAHMDTVAVKKGQAVTKGQVIGTMGNTGRSFGAHLHFEVRKDNVRIDPTPYLDADLPGTAAAKPKDIYSEEIKAFQAAAMADGIALPNHGANGWWGPESEKASRTGVVKSRLPAYKYKNLTKIVQRLVGVRVDGYCGEDTDAAIRAWQKKNGLEVDGAFGPACWQHYLKVD